MTRARGPVVLTALAAAWLTGPSAAQAQKTPRIVYTNRATFSLPVKMDERDRAELQELKFYAKAMHGNSPAVWVCKETASPAQTKFTFRAPHDGEYWFAFVTVDRAGAVAPTDLDREPPGLVVVVDTKVPEVDVRPMTAASGETLLQFQVRDSHPDLVGLRLEYQAADRAWRALEPVADMPGLFRVPSADVFRSVVRASASDKAGNRVTRDVDLRLPLPAPASAIVRDTAGPTILTSASRPSPTPATPRIADQPMVASPALRPGLTEPPMPRVPAPHAAAVEPAQTGSRIVVNNTRCTLDYALETGNVVRVEAFATRDGGRTWARAGEGRSPMTLTLPEEGVYGVSLVVSTANQPGYPPASGDTPDLFLEVDTTRPEVLIHSVQAGSGTDARVLTLTWSVQDRNPTADAIEIHGAPSVNGPWQPLVRGLKEKGTVQCAVPTDLGPRVFLRVQAADKAGNVGRWETREAILLEGSKPKARVIGVSAGR